MWVSDFVKKTVIWCAALVAAALMATGCTSRSASSPGAPASGVPVALTLSGSAAMASIRIGIVMPPVQGEGSQYRDAAEGAEVAVYRFGLSGAKVTLVAAQDGGTAAGLRAAVNSLVSQSVSGIVVATAGPHVDDVLPTLHVDVPLVLPYDAPASLPLNVWTTGPSQTGVAAGLAKALSGSGVSHPFALVQQGWTLPAGVQTAASAQVAPGDPLPAAVMSDISAGTADSVLIAASAPVQASLVAALQQGLGSRQVPVMLTPDALTPAFGADLAQAGASSSVLITVGDDADDPAAMASGLPGQQASAFFVALRLAAGDSSCKTVFGDAPFSTVAQSADTASQDAVVALVRGVEKAGSLSAQAVTDALPTLDLDQPDEGLAGPALNFTASSALPDDDVVPMVASTQNPGVRPQVTSGARSLFWFSTQQ